MSRLLALGLLFCALRAPLGAQVAPLATSAAVDTLIDASSIPNVLAGIGGVVQAQIARIAPNLSAEQAARAREVVARHFEGARLYESIAAALVSGLSTGVPSNPADRATVNLNAPLTLTGTQPSTINHTLNIAAGASMTVASNLSVTSTAIVNASGPITVGRQATLFGNVTFNEGSSLAAAALQFSLRDPRITATIVGMSRPERLQQTIDLALHPIPDELWPQLDALAPSPSLWGERSQFGRVSPHQTKFAELSL